MKQRTHINQTYSNTNVAGKTGKPRKRTVNHSHSIILSFALVVVCCCIFGSTFSSAHENTENVNTKNKCYRSIQVQAGDSLWSIARDNMTDEYNSINEYMDEIADINHISTVEMDSIQEGTYLTISYYNEI